MKKLLTLVLALAMLLSTASIGFAEVTDEWLENKNPKSWEADKSPVELEIFVNYSWYGSSWDDDAARRVTDETGVSLKISKPVADDNQKLMLMISSGEIPDYVCMDMNCPLYDTLIESGLVADLDTLADQYAPELRMNADEEVFNNYRWQDGKTYAFTTAIEGKKYQEWAKEYNALVGSNQPIWTIRKDYYDEIGRPDMTTPDAFIEALEKIKAAHPEKIGFYAGDCGLSSSLSESLSVTGLQFGIPSYLENEDGTLSHKLRSPQFHEALMFLHKLAAKELITRDSFIDTKDVNQTKVASGDCILYTWTIGDGKKVPEDNPETTYEILPPFETYSQTRTGNGWNATFVSAKPEGLERRTQFLSYLASYDGHAALFWGNKAAEGETYAGDPSKGPHYFLEETGKPTAFADYYADKQADWDGIEKSNGLSTYWFAASGLWNGINFWIPGDEEYAVYNNMYADHIVYKPEFAGIAPTVDSEAGVIKSKLDTLFETSCVKIVFAESEEAAETEYQNYIKKAEELGLATYEAALNEAYQANLKKMGK